MIATRPREKLARSTIEQLSDLELWMLILGRGSKNRKLEPLAQSVMDLLDRSRSPTLQDLTSLNGIHTIRAGMIQATLELGRRRYARNGHPITGPEEAFQILRSLGDRKQEHFLCLSLNGAGDLIQLHTITIGLVNRTLIHPREVFAPAMEDRAASILVAHNHPSGNLEPSQEDRDITRRLQEAGDLLGIPVLDHIVFHSRDFRSILCA